MLTRAFRRSRFAVIALVVCCTVMASGEPAMARNTKVTDSDNGRTVTLNRAGTLIVALASTPGTGYGWTVSALDARVLKEIGKPRLIHGAHPMPGAPATQVFRFSAAGAGSTRLELDYIRPWEKNVPPARIFRLDVTVR
jgi:inhibitor of cysteine peptidase